MTILSRQVEARIDGSNRIRIEEAVRNKTPVHFHFIRADFEPREEGEPTENYVTLDLSDAQFKRLRQALTAGQNEIILKLPHSQIKQQGGSFASLFSMALPILKTVGPALALGALGGVAQSVSKKATDKVTGQGASDVLSEVVAKTQHGFDLTKSQIDKVLNSIKTKTPIRLRLLNKQLKGKMILPVVEKTLKNIQSAIQAGSGLTVSFGGGFLADKLEEHSDGLQNGGAFGFLAPLLMSLPALLGSGQKKLEIEMMS